MRKIILIMSISGLLQASDKTIDFERFDEVGQSVKRTVQNIEKYKDNAKGPAFQAILETFIQEERAYLEETHYIWWDFEESVTIEDYLSFLDDLEKHVD